MWVETATTGYPYLDLLSSTRILSRHLYALRTLRQDRQDPHERTFPVLSLPSVVDLALPVQKLMWFNHCSLPVCKDVLTQIPGTPYRIVSFNHPVWWMFAQLRGRPMHIPYFDSLVQRACDDLVAAFMGPINSVDLGFVSLDARNRQGSFLNRNI